MTRRPALSLEEKNFIDRKVKRMGVTKLLSYIIWVFGGLWGLHRFYNGAIKTGVALLSMHILGLVFLFGALFSFITSNIDFSPIEEYVECIDDEPDDADEICQSYLEEDFQEQLSQNWGENGPDIPIVPLTIGGILFGGSVLWWLVDAFLIPGMVRRKNQQIKHKCLQDIMRYRRQEKEEQERQRVTRQRFDDEQGV